jgi:hypothetical protein
MTESVGVPETEKVFSPYCFILTGLCNETLLEDADCSVSGAQIHISFDNTEAILLSTDIPLA